MNPQPLVSVIVPNYNHARYLERRVRSVLDQTVTDLEVILLDDASTDGSQAILERFGEDPRVRLLFNSENSGSPFIQWNKGLRFARGEYIWIAESDDYAALDFLEKLLAVFETDASIVLAYSQAMRVDPNDVEQGVALGHSPIFDEERWAEDYIVDGADECRRILAIRNTIPNASGVLFKRSALERAGYANERMRLMGDWFFWVRIVGQGKLGYLAEPLNFFRLGTSHTLRGEAKRADPRLDEYVQIAEFIDDTHEIPAGVREKAAWRAAQTWTAFAIRSLLHPSLTPLALRHYRLLKARDSAILRRSIVILFDLVRQQITGKRDGLAVYFRKPD